MELETVEEGTESEVILSILDRAVLNTFTELIDKDTLSSLVENIENGLIVEIGTNKPNCDYINVSESIDGLKDILAMIAGSDRPEVMSSAFEFVLEGLHLNRLINKNFHGDKGMYVGN